MSDVERYIHLGASPEDNISSEKYSTALQELTIFVEGDSPVVSSLEDLSTLTTKARKALRDVIVSVGIFYLPPEVTISDPRNPGETAKTRLPGSFDFALKLGEESIHISVGMLDDENHLYISRTVFSELDLRRDEDKRKALQLVRELFPQIVTILTDELRGFDIVSDISQAVDLAQLDQVKKRFSDVGDLGEESTINLFRLFPQELAQAIFRALQKQIEDSLVIPRQSMEMHMPVFKAFQDCSKTEIGLIGSLEKLTAYSPVDRPLNAEGLQEFFERLKELIRDLLPHLPAPFHKGS